MTPALDSNVESDLVADQGAPPHCPPCYGPAQIRAAYDVPSGITGVGRTIVIIDGYQSPFVTSDMAGFDAVWGQPTVQLQILTPDGTTPFIIGSSVQRMWAAEESVDVEWAHAIAPDAHLVLVEAKTGDDGDILSATKYAIDHNLGDVISMSFSEAESCPTSQFLADEHAAFESAAAKEITLVAASGDHGAAQHSCAGPFVGGVGTPASDPLVTAVGGTRLVADPSTGAYQSEVAWNDQAGASGGGFSAIYRRPAYQAPFQEDNSARGVPDVAWHSGLAVATAVTIHGHIGPAVGTSVATAEWAGVAALADQAAAHRLGALNVHLYHAAKSNDAVDRFHDVMSGNNSLPGFTGFAAGPGWDAVTGLGSPDVANLVGWIASHSD